MHHGTANQYIKNGLTTNDMKSAWTLIKREYKGIFCYWSKKHLPKCLNEFTFKLDRKDILDRVIDICKNIIGSANLTYQQIIK